MKELIELLKQQAGVTDDQAVKSIEVIKNYTKSKFPMFGSAIDNLFEKYGDQEEKDFID